MAQSPFFVPFTYLEILLAVTGSVHLGLRLLVNWPPLPQPFPIPSPLQIPSTQVEYAPHYDDFKNPASLVRNTTVWWKLLNSPYAARNKCTDCSSIMWFFLTYGKNKQIKITYIHINIYIYIELCSGADWANGLCYIKYFCIFIDKPRLNINCYFCPVNTFHLHNNNNLLEPHEQVGVGTTRGLPQTHA
jgi:hypothetical protein